MDIGSTRPDPVFHHEPGDAGKLPFIIGYKHDAERAGVCGDPENIVCDQAAGALQLAPDPSVVLANIRPDGQDRNQR